MPRTHAKYFTYNKNIVATWHRGQLIQIKCKLKVRIVNILRDIHIKHKARYLDENKNYKSIAKLNFKK